MSSFDLLTGRSASHLTSYQNHLLHKKVLPSFKKLQKLAAGAGFNLQLGSSYRSFEKQLDIWNNKATGKKALLDSKGHALNFETLSKEEIVFSILRWSALPGASRHHWGSDFDIYDLNSVPSPDYKIQLTPEEVSPSGIMGLFHHWLDQQIAEKKSCGFYRPYQKDLGGVAPERWHISYAPLAGPMMEEYSYQIFLKNITLSNLANKELVLDHSLKIYCEYFANVAPPLF